jgi:hypothetical protein
MVPDSGGLAAWQAFSRPFSRSANEIILALAKLPATTTAKGVVSVATSSAMGAIKGGGTGGYTIDLDGTLNIPATLGSTAAWGSISGSILAQADLQTALASKLSTVSAATISDATSVGKSLLTAATAAVALAALGALGTTAQAYDSARLGGVAAASFVQTTDSRLSDARRASDVYAWAKAASKPSYTYAEVGSVSSSDTRLSDARPASDVYAWAKTAIKPGYSFGEIGPGPILATTIKTTQYNMALDAGDPAGGVYIGYNKGNGGTYFCNGAGSVMASISGAGALSATSLTDGYISMFLAQINRIGSDVNLQYPGGAGSAVTIFGGTGYGSRFSATTGAFSTQALSATTGNYTGTVTAPNFVVASHGRINATDYMVLNAAAGNIIYLNNDSGDSVYVGPGGTIKLNSNGDLSSATVNSPWHKVTNGAALTNNWAGSGINTTLWLQPGTYYDFGILNPAQTAWVMTVPTGTSNVVFGGKVTTESLWVNGVTTFKGLVNTQGGINGTVHTDAVNNSYTGKQTLTLEPGGDLSIGDGSGIVKGRNSSDVVTWSISAEGAANFSGGLVSTTGQFAGGGASPDPYGAVSSTVPNNADYANFALTRAGQYGMGMGITSGGAYWIGTTSGGLAGVKTGEWFRCNLGGAVFPGSLTVAGNITTGGRLQSTGEISPNLHLDPTAGTSAVYLNYYAGTGGTKFGDGGGSVVASISGTGALTATTVTASGLVTGLMFRGTVAGGHAFLDPGVSTCGTYINYNTGTGGVNFCNGAGGSVASVNSAGALAAKSGAFIGSDNYPVAFATTGGPVGYLMANGNGIGITNANPYGGGSLLWMPTGNSGFNFMSAGSSVATISNSGTVRARKLSLIGNGYFDLFMDDDLATMDFTTLNMNGAANVSGHFTAPNVVFGDNQTRSTTLGTGSASQQLPSGFYDGVGMSDLPPGVSSWCHLINSSHTSSYTGNEYQMQILSPFWQNRYFARTISPSALTGGWVEFYTTGNVNQQMAAQLATFNLSKTPVLMGYAEWIGRAASSFMTGQYVFVIDDTTYYATGGTLYHMTGPANSPATGSTHEQGTTTMGAVVAGTVSTNAMATQLALINQYISSTTFQSGMSAAQRASGNAAAWGVPYNGTGQPSGWAIYASPQPTICHNGWTGTDHSGWTTPNVQAEFGTGISLGGYDLSVCAIGSLINGGVWTRTSPGTYYWTCPPNITKCEVTLLAGGGSGSSLLGAGGGGAGGAIRKLVDVVPGTIYAITVPSGGTSVTNANYGNNGGNATMAYSSGPGSGFAPITVYGGQGGQTFNGGVGGGGGAQAGGAANGGSTVPIAGFLTMLSSGGAGGGNASNYGGSCGEMGAMGQNSGGSSAYGAGGLNNGAFASDAGYGPGAGGGGNTGSKASGAGREGFAMLRY